MLRDQFVFGGQDGLVAESNHLLIRVTQEASTVLDVRSNDRDRWDDASETERLHQSLLPRSTAKVMCQGQPSWSTAKNDLRDHW